MKNDGFEPANYNSQLKSLNLEWLRYFVVLAEVGNFSIAAEHLHITQQALSKAISGIESQLGIILIERKRNSNKLTDAGKLLLDKSRVVLNNLYDIDKTFDDFRFGKPGGTITIGVSSFCGVYILPEVLGSFLASFPDVYPKIYTMGSEEIEKLVLSGDIEIGLVVIPPEKKEVNYIEGKKIKTVIVGKPQPFKNWNDLEYIVFNYWRINLPSNWEEDKYKRKIIAEVDSLPLSLKLCELGMGAVFVPEITVRERIKKGSLAIIADSPFEHHKNPYIIWNRNIHQTSATRLLIEEIKKVL